LSGLAPEPIGWRAIPPDHQRSNQPSEGLAIEVVPRRIGEPIAGRHSEMTANLLMGKRLNSREFSEWALIDHANQADFDSAIPRFESWRPSQPVGSLAGDFGYSRKWRHFRRLAAKSLVSGDEFWTSGADGRKFRGSLCSMNFQYPKFGNGIFQRPVAFSWRPVRNPQSSSRDLAFFFQTIGRRSRNASSSDARDCVGCI
jgi:hypothetical protein